MILKPANKIKFYLSALIIFILVSCGESPNATQNEARRPPNFILIFCDDLGYGDLASYGSTINRTSNIDQMAKEGIKLTSFYTSASVCTPSRASLLTGCYPQRIDMAEVRKEGFRSVLLPAAHHGLNPKEITLAEILKPAGYATACIGKWHLGDQPQFLPTRQGFDTYFGIPYSNNMHGEKGVPLMSGEKVIEQPVDQSTLTQRYTAEAIKFMEEHKDRPFFIYLPHTMPHAPLHASERFAGKSQHGIYSDAIEEIDWSVGEILQYLKNENLAENTFVFFTSDNGGVQNYGGVNTPLRAGKGTTWEGGMRVPAIAWWPGAIPPGLESDAICTVMDLLPTYHQLVYDVPFNDATIDGFDISPLLNAKEKESPYQAFFYYDRDQLQAVRSRKWKLHLPLEHRYKGHHTDEGFAMETQLYNLDEDIGEKENLAEKYPEKVEELLQYAESAKNILGDTARPSPFKRPAGKVLKAEEPKL